MGKTNGRHVNKRAATDEHRAIGIKLRAARLEKGMSQIQLGRALGISFQQVQKYEKGVNRFDVARLTTISNVLGVTPDYFTPEVCKKGERRFEEILATREGTKVLEAMIDMNDSQRAFLVEMARKLLMV